MTLTSKIQLHEKAIYDASNNILLKDAKKQALDWFLLTNHPILPYRPICRDESLPMHHHNDTNRDILVNETYQGKISCLKYGHFESNRITICWNLETELKPLMEK